MPREMFIVLISATLASCASDPASVEPGPASDTPRSVGSSGGILQVESEDGTTLTLDVPAGAVLAETPISLAAVPPESGELARFSVEPAGLRFRRPVEITISEPDGVVFDQFTRVTMDSPNQRVTSPTVLDAAAGTVSSTSWFLGFSTAGDPAKNQIGFLNVEQIDCQLQLATVEQRLLMAQQFEFSVDSVYQLTLEFKAAQQCLDVDPGALTLVEAAIQNAACEAQEKAIQDAAFAMAEVLDPVDELETLRELISPILGSEAARILTDAPCFTSGQAIPEIESSYQTFTENFRERAEQPDFLTGPGVWGALWGKELGMALELQGDAEILGIQSVVEETREVLLPLILDQFRRAAYERCGEDHTQQYLADIKTGGHLFNHPISPSPAVPDWANFTSEDIADDVQYCSSHLEIKSYDAVAQQIDQVDLGGTGPGLFDAQVEIDVPSDGFIDLAGTIYDLFCSGGSGTSQFADDNLVILANSQVLETLSPALGSFLATPFDLSMSQTLESLGFTGNGEESFSLRVVRQGDGCGGDYGSTPFELFAIQVNSQGCPSAPKDCVENGPVVVEGLNIPATVGPAGVQVTLRAGYDQGGSEPDWAGGIHVSLVNASDDPDYPSPYYANPSTGLTDASGFFTFQLVPQGEEESVAIEVRAEEEGNPINGGQAEFTIPLAGVFLARWSSVCDPWAFFHVQGEDVIDEHVESPDLRFDTFDQIARNLTAADDKTAGGFTGTISTNAQQSMTVAGDGNLNLNQVAWSGSATASGTLSGSGGGSELYGRSINSFSVTFVAWGSVSYSLSGSLGSAGAVTLGGIYQIRTDRGETKSVSSAGTLPPGAYSFSGRVVADFDLLSPGQQMTTRNST